VRGDPDGGTIGGALAVGHSGIRRLGWGPVRDTVLQVRYVSAAGEVVKAGGPTVKNVSGFDLCRCSSARTAPSGSWPM
jgi:FAD/FMN-containing dehydrogenase